MARAPRTISLGEISASFEALAAQVGSSTVQVLASGLALDPDAATGDGVVERRRSSGSGVILDAAGHVMTNYHVVQGARRVQVVMASRPQGTSIVRPRGRTLDATVVGVDEETDLALLKVSGATFAQLPLGDSDTLRPGQLVFAFGSPLGLDNTVTMGVVSAVGRQLEPDDPMVYIQTDAPINPGSSGGPLVNAQGQVVGINTLILSQGGGNEGLGFAAPSNIVRSVYEQLKAHGRVRRGSIGVLVQSITPVLAEALQLPQDTGAFVADVDADGPAAKAGLRIGDIGAERPGVHVHRHVERDRLPVVHHGQVHLTGGHGGQGIPRVHLDQADLYLGCRDAEIVHRLGHQATYRGRERRHAQPPGGAALARLHRGGELLELGQDRPGPLDQQPAGFGQDDAAPHALQQRHPGLGLEFLDLLRDGRGGVAEPRGGRDHRSVTGHRHQRPQRHQIHHEARLLCSMHIYLLVLHGLRPAD